MASLRIWIILSWIALPTVMFGGYSLLRPDHNALKDDAIKSARRVASRVKWGDWQSATSS